MSYKVGDIVRIKIHEELNGWLHLVSKDDMLPPAEDRCYFTEVQICGCFQMSSDDFIALCDFDPHGYLSWKITAWHQKGYDVANKFLGMRGLYINTEHIWPVQAPLPKPQVKLNRPGGMNCKLCNNFIQYASVNRDDGTFACRKCVTTKGWMLKCKPLQD